MRTKKHRKQPTMPTFYVLTISRWEWSFHFGVDRTKYATDPYSDYRHLELSGTARSPKVISAKPSTLILMPEREMDYDLRQKHSPPCVGSLQLHTEGLQGLFRIPADVLTQLMISLEAEKLKYAILMGEKLRYRKALIQSLQLCESCDEEDYADD